MYIGLLLTSKKLKNKIAFYFKNTDEDIVMTVKDEED